MGILVVVSGVSLAAWLWLALARGGFWRTDLRLPAAGTPSRWPSVAVIVPARDESAVLPTTLAALLRQDYPGQFRVIVVDDASTDGTGRLAASLGATVVHSEGPPAGWTGKLAALSRGLDAAQDAEFVLLTDADILHEPGSLTSLVRVAASGYALVSQMARLRTATMWERLIVPAFVYFFALLYPFRWSNRVGSHTAAAAGGCTLVRRDILESAGGLAAVRSAVIDDVAIAGLVKRAGGRTWLGLADQVESVRAYARLADLCAMVARSAFSQLKYSVWLLIGTVMGLALVFLVPVAGVIAGLAAGAPLAALLGGAAWLVMAVTYVPMLRYYGQPVIASLLLPLTASLYLAMTVDSARRHWSGRGAAWKGRTYPALH